MWEEASLKVSLELPAKSISRMRFMLARGSKPTALSKLFQKPLIALKEQLNIVDPILQDRDAVRANAEGHARDRPRVVAVVLHELEDVGIDHAAAQNLDPARGLAR